MDLKIKYKPRDIRTKQFSKKVFGYDPDEVEAFLIEISNDVQALLAKIEELENQQPEAKVSDLVKKAKKEIEKVLEESKNEKKQLEFEKEKLKEEIEKLKSVQKKISNKIKLTIIEMTKLFEGIKPEDEHKKEGKQHFSRVESPAEGEEK